MAEAHTQGHIPRNMEVRWPGEGSQESGSFALSYGGAERPEFGTGFLVRRRILSAIREVQFVSDRISYLILKGKRHDFVIVNVQYMVPQKIRMTR